MDGNMEVVDLTSDQHDMDLTRSPTFQLPANSFTSNEQAVANRLQQFRNPGSAPQELWTGSLNNNPSVGQDSRKHKQMRQESIKQEHPSSIMNSIEGRDHGNNHFDRNGRGHRSNGGFRDPTALPDPPSYRDSQSSFQLVNIDIDTMDNERAPVRPDYGTPSHQRSKRRDSRYEVGDEDMSMDETPSKRQRVERGNDLGERRSYDERGGYRRTEAGAFTTLTAASRSHRSSFQNSSSSSHRHHQSGGMMGAQARSQHHGAAARTFNFNPTPLSRHATPSTHRPRSVHPQPQPTTTIPQSIITQDDLHRLILDLQTAIAAHQSTTAQLHQICGTFMTEREKIRKEQRDQNEHMNATLAKFAGDNQAAIKDLHEANKILQAQINELNLRDPTRPPTRGGAYGGSALGQARTESVFSNLVQPQTQPQSQTRAPTAPMMMTPGPNRGGS
ncbi:hypothetical protein M409DRAFT_19035 [Zasmidium cellare ATCC 36951]|uniref:Uncharacterized protein n=1 Tax=Zasmidium cellare ATCC 36951 TaxID=1080233 RepID=A0A6A6CYV1_ZASCE|nr:uncharacterized protein M409DRAFT_19035 [Zasmidium cellare ATCC 36951]KAF2171062.1 hypothetical protein M409DRAFT_19035 [Zasmidium cellare ATCC 36951]